MTTHLDLDALRALASCADAVAIPDAIARRMAAALLAAADEVERARTTIACLNRRCQKAEGIIARAGIVEGRDTASPHGRGSGRALANYAADMYRRERDEAVARLDALTGAAPRATLPAMATLPTLERLGYAYYLRRRAPSDPTWDRLTAAQQAGEVSAVRWVCDTALGADGAGVIYAASPGDPPPTSPAP